MMKSCHSYIENDDYFGLTSIKQADELFQKLLTHSEAARKKEVSYMDMDKTMLPIDIKVEIGHLRQTIQESEKSFVTTQQAHKSLLQKLAGSIRKSWEDVAKKLEETA